MSSDHELRHVRRERILLAGRLVFPDMLSVRPCIVRDLTEGGARVRLPAADPVPDLLILVVSRGSVAYEAAVSWKRLPELGLRFTGFVQLQNPSTPLAAMLHQVALEMGQR